MNDYDDYYEGGANPDGYPRDSKVDEAKAVLRAELFVDRRVVVYQRQVEVKFERRFFHWITAKALNELLADREIAGEARDLGDQRLSVYWNRRHRYPRRQIGQIETLVRRISAQPFTRAIGRHGETMVDAALPRAGLLPVAWNVRAWQDKSWTRTNHDLDRVYRGKGVNFGVEVKNTLAYIDREELTHKLAMCRELQLVPLFVMRMAPASYIELVRQQGGFTWLFEWQLYPFGHEDFAREVQEGLGYKVGCPRALEQGTVDRLVKWLSRHGHV